MKTYTEAEIIAIIKDFAAWTDEAAAAALELANDPANTREEEEYATGLYNAYSACAHNLRWYMETKANVKVEF